MTHVIIKEIMDNNQFSSIGDVTSFVNISKKAFASIKHLGGFGILECGINKYVVCFATMSIIRQFVRYDDLYDFAHKYGSTFFQKKVVIQEFDGFSVYQITRTFTD